MYIILIILEYCCEWKDYYFQYKLKSIFLHLICKCDIIDHQSHYFTHGMCWTVFLYMYWYLYMSPFVKYCFQSMSKFSRIYNYDLYSLSSLITRQFSCISNVILVSYLLEFYFAALVYFNIYFLFQVFINFWKRSSNGSITPPDWLKTLLIVIGFEHTAVIGWLTSMWLAVGILHCHWLMILYAAICQIVHHHGTGSQPSSEWRCPQEGARFKETRICLWMATFSG